MKDDGMEMKFCMGFSDKCVGNDYGEIDGFVNWVFKFEGVSANCYIGARETTGYHDRYLAFEMI
jgi:hypothetical protein